MPRRYLIHEQIRKETTCDEQVHAVGQPVEGHVGHGRARKGKWTLETTRTTLAPLGKKRLP
jgi:hypothetical protein